MLACGKRALMSAMVVHTARSTSATHALIGPRDWGVFLREIYQLVAPDQLHGNIISVPNSDINYWFPKWER